VLCLLSCCFAYAGSDLDPEPSGHLPNSGPTVSARCSASPAALQTLHLCTMVTVAGTNGEPEQRPDAAQVRNQLWPASLIGAALWSIAALRGLRRVVAGYTRLSPTDPLYARYNVDRDSSNAVFVPTCASIAWRAEIETFYGRS
jgi:hypothetical protein